MSLEMIDRETELKTIKDNYDKVFSVITSVNKINYCFYGIPEIGKTRLLEEIKKTIKKDNPNAIIIFLTLTTNKNIAAMDLLLNIRNQFPKECPIFDYALRKYLDYISPFRLKALSEKTITAVEVGQNVVTDILSYYNPANIFLNCLPIATFIENYRKHRLKLKVKNQSSSIFERIQQIFNNNTPLELIEYMPEFLATNINEYNKQFPLVMIIDKIEHLNTYPWLVDFINRIDQGLFIMAGKENILNYPFNPKPVCKRLLNIPEKDIQAFFEEKIDLKDFSLISKIVRNIKNPSQIEYYIVEYNKIREKTTSEIEMCLLKKPPLNIIPYISYLDKDVQSLIKTLSVLGIFDQTLFHRLLGISNIHYFDRISQLTYINEIYKNEDLILYSIPDEICTTLTETFSIQAKREILVSALNIIIDNHMGNDVFIAEKYFLAFLSKFNELNATIDSKVTESILDLFFNIYQSCNVALFFDKIKFVTNTNLKNLIKYIEFALYISFTKKENFNHQSEFRYLVNIDFGKHLKSLHLLEANQLCSIGDYKEGIRIFKDIYEKLLATDKEKWFYGKSVINYGDSMMLKGQFKSALLAYKKYNETSNECWRFNNNFDEKRQRAHTFRFNADWNQAQILYEHLLNDYNFSDNLRSYALVGLCETLCYTNADYVIGNYKSIVELCNNMMNQKSMAKVYYAAGISYTVKRDYENAKSCIETSITLNHDASYPSGVLFALIAQCYWEYAQSKTITHSTIRRIELLLKKIQVYKFLKLPLYIMTDNKEEIEKCKNEFEWIDFEKTYFQIENFIKLL